MKIELQTFPGVMLNLDPFGSAVLTFIGYKQTDKQSIYRQIHMLSDG